MMLTLFNTGLTLSSLTPISFIARKAAATFGFGAIDDHPPAIIPEIDKCQIHQTQILSKFDLKPSPPENYPAF